MGFCFYLTLKRLTLQFKIPPKQKIEKVFLSNLEVYFDIFTPSDY